jgi:hypothetical protein
VTFQITLLSLPQATRDASSGSSWVIPVVTVLIGATAALAAQWVIQVYLVPRVETRKRREDRWERNVLELGDLLTTQLAERANDAHVGQGLFRDLRQLETDPKLDQRKIAQSREDQAREAQQATRAFEDLLSTRIKWLTGRIEKINPKAREIKKVHEAAAYYRAITISVQVCPQDDSRTDDEFDEAWAKERVGRKALIEQVELLADLPHPPVRRGIRWRRRSPSDNPLPKERRRG